MAEFQESAERAKEGTKHYWERGKDFGQQAFNRSKDYYQTASDWVSENRGASIGLVSTAVGFGLIGYLIGRSGQKELPASVERVSSVGSSIEKSISPIFKFLKLYFLYRVAV